MAPGEILLTKEERESKLLPFYKQRKVTFPHLSYGCLAAHIGQLAWFSLCHSKGTMIQGQVHLLFTVRNL